MSRRDDPGTGVPRRKAQREHRRSKYSKKAREKLADSLFSLSSALATSIVVTILIVPIGAMYQAMVTPEDDGPSVMAFFSRPITTENALFLLLYVVAIISVGVCRRSAMRIYTELHPDPPSTAMGAYDLPEPTVPSVSGTMPMPPLIQSALPAAGDARKHENLPGIPVVARDASASQELPESVSGTDAPAIVLIAALDTDRAIGRDGGMPWHLPDDLRRFKALTLGKPVLMGRRTADALGRALPGRRNLVLTRAGRAPFEGMEAVASLDAAVAAARAMDAHELCVIGGGEVYALALPRADRMHLTHVDAAVSGADAFFPAYDADDWRAVARETRPADARHAFGFAFVDYVRA